MGNRIIVDSGRSSAFSEQLAAAGHLIDQAVLAPKMDDGSPTVSVIIPVTDGEAHLVDAAVATTRTQRGVTTEIVVADLTRDGSVATESAPVVRPLVPCRVTAIHQALTLTSHAMVALHLPQTEPLPAQLARAVQALSERPNVDIITSAHHLRGDDGQLTEVIHAKGTSTAPQPFWESGLVARREALQEMPSTMFLPGELTLLRSSLAKGRVVHLSEPGFSVAAGAHSALTSLYRDDAELCDLHGSGTDADRPEPELTVSMCTYERREVLAESLAAFARQLLTPGRFELVVVNDGSSDGTAEMLDALDCPVPIRILHTENRGLAAARNTGLGCARGELVMFVNDDTIPARDCVARHIAAHRSHPGERLCVLGTFEQPPDALTNALTRYLEQSSEVFGYGQMESGSRYGAFKFMTCNVSVALAAVRATGAFDESFRHYGCEDTDLGFRLEAAGFSVLFDRTARATHRHVLDVDDLEKRQRTVAAAYVRLFRKHPHALAQWGHQGRTIASCRAQIDSVRDSTGLRQLDASLAKTDLGDPAAPGTSLLVENTLDALGQALRPLNELWWAEGYVEGFEALGLTGFADFFTTDRTLHGFSSDRPRRVLAWPDWGDPDDITRLLTLARPLADDDETVLVLRHDPVNDPDIAGGLALLEAVYEQTLGRFDVEILLEDRPLSPDEFRRLGRSVDAVLPMGPRHVDLCDLIAAEPIADVASVARWRRRTQPIATSGG
jgi:GT2 family glycosyltransferase